MKSINSRILIIIVIFQLGGNHVLHCELQWIVDQKIIRERNVTSRRRAVLGLRKRRFVFR